MKVMKRVLVIVWMLCVNNAFAQESAPVKAVSLQHVEEVLEWLGVLPALRQVPQVVEMSLRGQLLQVDNPSAQMVHDAIARDYADVATLQKSVVASVAAHVEPSLLVRAHELLQAPLPQAMRQAHDVMQGSSALADMNQYHRLQVDNALQGERKRALADIDRVMHISIFLAMMQSRLDQSINQRLASQQLVALDEEAWVKQKKGLREKFSAEQTEKILLFVYKNKTDGALREYAAQMGDSAIQHVLGISQRTVESVLKQP